MIMYDFGSKKTFAMEVEVVAIRVHIVLSLLLEDMYEMLKIS